MNSYLAKLVFNIAIGNENKSSQFDEQVRIIQANSLEEAFLKARTIGKQQEEFFMNNNNELVNWKFIDVTDLYALQEANDGDELYANTHETESVDSFIAFVRQKAMLIQTKFLTFA